jgi:hypothetical protein
VPRAFRRILQASCRKDAAVLSEVGQQKNAKACIFFEAPSRRLPTRSGASCEKLQTIRVFLETSGSEKIDGFSPDFVGITMPRFRSSPKRDTKSRYPCRIPHRGDEAKCALRRNGHIVAADVTIKSRMAHACPSPHGLLAGGSPDCRSALASNRDESPNRRFPRGVPAVTKCIPVPARRRLTYRAPGPTRSSASCESSHKR